MLRQLMASRRSVFEVTGHIVLASAIGFIGLPFVFANLPDVAGARAWVWLATAIGISTWLLLVAPTVAGYLALLLAQSPGPSPRRESVGHAAAESARLVVAIGYLILVQGIVRRPLVAALGARADAFAVEATFAAIALVALFFLLTWLYQAGRASVEGVVSAALDTVLATTGMEASTTPLPPVDTLPAVTRLATDHQATLASVTRYIHE